MYVNFLRQNNNMYFTKWGTFASTADGFIIIYDSEPVSKCCLSAEFSANLSGAPGQHTPQTGKLNLMFYKILV